MLVAAKWLMEDVRWMRGVVRSMQQQLSPDWIRPISAEEMLKGVQGETIFSSGRVSLPYPPDRIAAQMVKMILDFRLLIPLGAYLVWMPIPEPIPENGSPTPEWWSGDEIRPLMCRKVTDWKSPQISKDYLIVECRVGVVKEAERLVKVVDRDGWGLRRGGPDAIREITGVLQATTEKAVLLEMDGAMRWIPKSQIIAGWSRERENAVRIGDTMQFLVPMWLWEKIQVEIGIVRRRKEREDSTVAPKPKLVEDAEWRRAMRQRIADNEAAQRDAARTRTKTLRVESWNRNDRATEAEQEPTPPVRKRVQPPTPTPPPARRKFDFDT